MDREDLARLAAGEGASYLAHPDPALRQLAISVLVSRGGGEELLETLVGVLDGDPDQEVRAEAAEALGTVGGAALDRLLATARDPWPRVAEAAVTALGELADPSALPLLVELATTHPETLVQEAAVAALGAVGDPGALPVLLELVREGRPQVRRRAVVALTVFDDPRVEPALLAARLDRNPMVREAAEMVVGRG